jgi:predicted DNA-binding transcriptional regulator YafY
MQQSFSIVRVEHYDIVLRVHAEAVELARPWRFHPSQEVKDNGDEMLIRFRSGGPREIAEHVFTWGGDIVIEEPETLRTIMRERLAAGQAAL